MDYFANEYESRLDAEIRSLKYQITFLEERLRDAEYRKLKQELDTPIKIKQDCFTKQYYCPRCKQEVEFVTQRCGCGQMLRNYGA